MSLNALVACSPSRTVPYEKNVAEALGLEQPVDQSDAGLRLGGTNGHDRQQLAGALGDRLSPGADGILLVVAQGESIVEAFLGQIFVSCDLIALLQRHQVFRCVPAIQGLAQVRCPARGVAHYQTVNCRVPRYRG